MDDDLLLAMGLLLQQVRFSRLALEDIERSTARYAGVVVSTSAAAPLGTPPLQDGALRVHVVNLSDLAGGSGLGDVLGGILGGTGRFLGGLVGGLVGGTVAGVALPYSLHQVTAITGNVAEILRRTGSGGGPAAESTGPSLLDQLDRIDGTLERLAIALGAATTDPTAARPGESAGQAADRTAQLREWMGLALQVGHVVDGAVLLVPLLTGALASFLDRLPGMQVLVLELLEFAVRNVLRLRAVVLAVVVDSVEAVARLSSAVLATLASLVDAVLSAVFRVVEAALVAGFSVLRTLGPGLALTLDRLVAFLENDVAGALNTLGDTPPFRLVTHLTLVLPMVLPALARVMKTPLDATESSLLLDAARLQPPQLSRGPAATRVGAPDLSTLLSQQAQQDALAELHLLSSTVASEASGTLDAARSAVADVAGAANRTVAGMDRGLGVEMTARLRTADAQAGALAAAMTGARASGGGLPQLEQIAGAYERWLAGPGLTTLLGRLTEHFTSGATAARSVEALLRPAADASAGAAPPAVPVQIDRIEIRIAPPHGPTAGGATPRWASVLDTLDEHDLDVRDRGGAHLSGVRPA